MESENSEVSSREDSEREQTSAEMPSSGDMQRDEEETQVTSGESADPSKQKDTLGKRKRGRPNKTLKNTEVASKSAELMNKFVFKKGEAISGRGLKDGAQKPPDLQCVRRQASRIYRNRIWKNARKEKESIPIRNLRVAR